MIDRIISNLKQQGFTKGFENILSQHDIQECKKIINSLFEDGSFVEHSSANCPVISNLPGKNSHLDALLEKLVSNVSVKSVLIEVLGDNYKIWQLNARRSIPGDGGLYLHQDAPGETNLVLLLTDNSIGDGATAFLPNSHKLPRWAKYVSWSNVRLASSWLKPLLGKSGDTAFFFNRTWHMRLKNKSLKSRDVLLISFFPQGATYSPNEINQNSIPLKKDSELQRLLDPSIGTKKLEDGRYKIIPDNKDESKVAFALQLETSQCAIKFDTPFHLYIMLGIFELVFRPMRFFYKAIESSVKLKSKS